MSKTQADILEAWLRSKPSAHGLRHADRTAPIPASYAQQGFWIAHEIGGRTGTTYLARHLYRIRGPLDIELLSAAFTELFRRHEILRTTFREEDGEIFQVVNSGAVLTLDPEQVAGQEELAVELDAAMHRPVDLESGNLFRPQLFQTSGDEYFLLLVIHHLLNDAWSMDVIHADLTELYTALLERRDPCLPPVEFHYADFAAWQHEQVAAGAFAEDLEYWRRQLADAPRVTELPTIGDRPAVQSFVGQRTAFEVGRETVSALDERAKALGTTRFVLTLSAFAVAIARWGRLIDFVVAVPVIDRPLPETEQMVGPFLNILPLRFRLEGLRLVADVVDQAREVLNEGTRHQSVPFELLVRELRVAQSPAHNPIAQLMISSHQGTLERVTLPGLTVDYLETAPRDAQRDLTVELDSEPDGSLRLGVSSAQDLFDAASIDAFRSHLVGAIEQIARGGPTPIGDVRAEPRSGITPPGVTLDDAALPTGPVADAVLDAWRSVLGVGQLGADADFFHLGGTSMSAMRLCSRLRRDLGIRVPVRIVFETSKLRRFTTRVSELVAESET